MAQIRETFGTKDPNPALRLLWGKGILILEANTSWGVGGKRELVASLAIPPEEAMALVTPRRRSAPLQYIMTELLCAIGSASAKELRYFTSAANVVLRSLEKSSIFHLERQEVFRRATVEAGGWVTPPVLNAGQQAAFEGLDALATAGRPAATLLYRVTDSGETQVYLRLIYEALIRGRTAMVLVSGIALAPQFPRILASYFGGGIAVLHPSLRAGERYDEWKRVRSGQVRIVIDTRSAVSAPLRNLGLLILDEEQEFAYKLKNVPRYRARDVAKYRCAQNDALLVLGSATSSVKSMYHARWGDYRLFTLRRRYNRQAMPEVLIADMRQELRADNGTSLSGSLRAGLAATMETGEQSILLLNRRGASRVATHGKCGEVPTCPYCSVHLTYHSANGRFMCHYCGHSEPLPDACPSCGGALNFLGYSTQKVEKELHAAFPGREILRVDIDTVSATQSREELPSRSEKEWIPVLVGTQVVAKELDFENVILVGVISANLSLYADDCRVEERTSPLLTQVVGRAGRGAEQRRAIIRTSIPENDVIRYAACQDYGSFYEQEVESRRIRLYPPSRELFVLTASGPLESTVLHTCMYLRHSLERWLAQPPFRGRKLTVPGPVPASVTKINDHYRYHLTPEAQNTKEVRAMVAHLIHYAQTDKKNEGVSVLVDVSPLDQGRDTMVLRKILTNGDTALYKMRRPVTGFDARLHMLLDDLKETLVDANGAGLAAPQVGILHRVVIVVDAEDNTLELASPEVVSQEGEREGFEGCLLAPGRWGVVKHSYKVRVRAQDHNDSFFEAEGEEIVAHCFCHEIGHPDGHLFTGYADRLYTTEELDRTMEGQEE